MPRSMMMAVLAFLVTPVAILALEPGLMRANHVTMAAISMKTQLLVFLVPMAKRQRLVL